jgi:hypothetical protein
VRFACHPFYFFACDKVERRPAVPHSFSRPLALARDAGVARAATRVQAVAAVVGVLQGRPQGASVRPSVRRRAMHTAGVPRRFDSCSACRVVSSSHAPRSVAWCGRATRASWCAWRLHRPCCRFTRTTTCSSHGPAENDRAGTRARRPIPRAARAGPPLPLPLPPPPPPLLSEALQAWQTNRAGARSRLRVCYHNSDICGECGDD